MIRFRSVLFWLILIISLITRFVYLDKYPPSLNWDEISHGYNAYSLLLTGKDQWGVSWPVFNFRAYGDYPTALNLYLTIPFIKIFGLNAFAIRLPAAILSFFFIISCYFLAKILFKDKILALFVILLAAISPWTIFSSRAVFQSNLSQLFLLLGVYYYLKSNKLNHLFIVSTFFFILSLFSYHNSRIVAPLVFSALFLYQRFRFNKYTLPSFIVLLFFFAINLVNLFSPDTLARNKWVGIINPASVNLINERRNNFSGPYFINIALNNKVTYFSQIFSQNIINFFNPIPLFFTGTTNFQFNVVGQPLIYPIFLPFFYIGIAWLLFNFKKSPIHRLIFSLFLICLIPAALTVGDFPSVRLSLAIPYYFLVISIGLVQTLSLFSKYKTFLTASVVIITLLSFFRYWNIYSTQYFKNYSQVWQYGYQQVIDIIKNKYPDYDQIFFTKKYGEPHEFILFYWPRDPLSYQNDPKLNWDFHSDWYWVNSFDKFIFVNDWEVGKLDIPPKSLLVTSPNNYPVNKGIKIDTINFLNGLPAFDIVSYE